MEMDIGANNYPFQCFLCFLTLKLHPSFLLTTINHKSCTFHTTENISYTDISKFQNFKTKF